MGGYKSLAWYRIGSEFHFGGLAVIPTEFILDVEWFWGELDRFTSGILNLSDQSLLTKDI